MVGEPVVDDRLDDAAPAEGAADEAPAALGLEVAQELRVARVALAAARDLGVDGRVGDLDALGLGDLREHEERLDALLGRRPELLVEVGLGLLHHLEIGLLGDALAGDRAAELVVHHLDLLVDEHLGQLDVALATAYSMILSANSWRARSIAFASSRRWMSVAQRLEVVEVAQLVDEVVVELGQDLLAQLLDVDREVHRLAGQLGLAVVLGERDVELGRARRLQPDEVGLEARDQPLLAEDERHPLRRCRPRTACRRACPTNAMTA